MEHSKGWQQRLYKRTLLVVLLSQTLGGAGLAAGITVGALLAKEMLGIESVSGLPSALFTLGSALFAYLVGRITQKYGRRMGLSFGFLAGSIGALGVVAAANIDSIVLLFVSLFIYGAGTSTNLQARYAGTDLAEEHQRAKAVSIALVATTFGAVAGPNLVAPMGKVAQFLHMPALSGPFLLSAVAYSAAGLVFWFLLKPDPLLVARKLAEQSEQTVQVVSRNIEKQVQRMGVVVGATVLILSHVVMVAIMTMTPIHMQHYGNAMSAIGLTIGLHVAAMYLPSLITGSLVDKVGRIKMVIASAFTLTAAGLLAAFAPGESTLLLTVALILLGLGWNFGLISGTAIIIDSTTIENRAKIQGSVDVGVALGGSAGSLLSGVIVAYTSYAALGFVGVYISLLLIPLVIWSSVKKRRSIQVDNQTC
ncbi:MFS transporter [Bacillus sp. AGMB 02131]|uniref:MFS transporter n=1 Tax=Peribacillus faecalis TaxID=2772559 RepID=A0A927HAF0_9BACI|nr:MFS transporter [Peribacillus faecalis]MBD3107482.1 MFS transporter [Peribacillus faecalis]